MHPLVSIITPNYNDAPFLAQTIQSVLSQDYPNLEMVLVDDGSTDNSLEIIHSFASDRRITLLTHAQNKGAIFSINEGLFQSKGKYVLFLSANDYLLPQFISKSMSQLIHNPAVGICTTDAIEIQVATQTYHPTHYIPWMCEATILETHALPKIFLKSHLKLRSSTTIVHKELVMQEGGFNEKLHCSCDWYLVTKIAFNTGLAYIPEPLMCWRNMGNCYTTSILKNRRLTHQMYSTLLDELGRSEKKLISQFKNAGELGCVLKFAPMEILKRPQFWSSCPPSLFRYIKRVLNTRVPTVALSRQTCRQDGSTDSSAKDLD